MFSHCPISPAMTLPASTAGRGADPQGHRSRACNETPRESYTASALAFRRQKVHQNSPGSRKSHQGRFRRPVYALPRAPGSPKPNAWITCPLIDLTLSCKPFGSTPPLRLAGEDGSPQSQRSTPGQFLDECSIDERNFVLHLGIRCYGDRVFEHDERQLRVVQRLLLRLGNGQKGLGNDAHGRDTSLFEID